MLMAVLSSSQTGISFDDDDGDNDDGGGGHIQLTFTECLLYASYCSEHLNTTILGDSCYYPYFMAEKMEA